MTVFGLGVAAHDNWANLAGQGPQQTLQIVLDVRGEQQDARSRRRHHQQ
jgi:hypothetical protein